MFFYISFQEICLGYVVLETKVLSSFYFENYGVGMGSVLLFLSILTFLPVGCSLLMLHLMYYQMSYHIRLLRYRIKIERPVNRPRLNTENVSIRY